MNHPLRHPRGGACISGPGAGAAVAAIWFALIPLQAAAEMYKWVDENGHTQFADHPPPAGIKYETVGVKLPTAPATPATTDAAKAEKLRIQKQELEFRKRQVVAAEQEAAEAKKKKEAALRAEDCESARTKLRNMQEDVPIYNVNAKGGRDYMTDAERASATENWKKRVDELCN
jgi:hypothetical protein